MPDCILRKWICGNVASDWDSLQSKIDEKTESWERLHSNYSELWAIEPEPDRIEEANGIASLKRKEAFAIYLDLANQGSIIGMLMAGWYYEFGSSSAETPDYDLAAHWYIRAINQRSWLATLAYARLSAKKGQYEDCEAVLADGVRKGWAPAYFWLAWYRHKQSPGRQAYGEIQRLLQYAAEQGHPGAKFQLARRMGRGKFGIRQIPHGIRLFGREVNALMAEQG